MPEERRITFRLGEADLIEKLEKHLKDTKIPMSTYIRDLIERDLDGKGASADIPDITDENALEKLYERFHPSSLRIYHDWKKINPEISDTVVVYEILESLRVAIDSRPWDDFRTFRIRSYSNILDLPKLIRLNGSPHIDAVGYFKEIPRYLKLADLDFQLRRVLRAPDVRKMMELANGIWPFLKAAGFIKGEDGYPAVDEIQSRAGEIYEALREELAGAIEHHFSQPWPYFSESELRSMKKLVKQARVVEPIDYKNSSQLTLPLFEQLDLLFGVAGSPVNEDLSKIPHTSSGYPEPTDLSARSTEDGRKITDKNKRQKRA